MEVWSSGLGFDREGVVWAVGPQTHTALQPADFEVAGVPGLLLHDLSRTADRNLRRAGIAGRGNMKIGGWRTRSVFERYAIVSLSDIAYAMKSGNRAGARRAIACFCYTILEYVRPANTRDTCPSSSAPVRSLIC